MNELFTDFQYIELLYKLSEHLLDKYRLTLSQIQEVRSKLNLVVEEAIERACENDR